jgi:hypothetical protein
LGPERKKGLDVKSVSEYVYTLTSPRLRPDLGPPLGSGVTKNRGYDNTTDRGSAFYFRNMIFHKYINNLKKLGAEVTYLFNIPRVGEELAINGLELVGAWSEHLRDDVWFFPWRRPWGWMHVPRHEATNGSGVLIASRSPNENVCQGVLGEIRRGERFSSRKLCGIVGRGMKSDISPPGTAGVPKRLRAGIPATYS